MTMDPFANDPRTQAERMLAGDLYRADDPTLTAQMTRAARLADRYHRQRIAGDPAAGETLATLIGNLGEDVEIRSPLFVDYGKHIAIGPRTFINFNLDRPGRRHDQHRRRLPDRPERAAPHTAHPAEPQLRRDRWESAQPITIGDNVWLGGGVIVCPGVRIGDNAVVGAGSVVTRDIPANVLAAGTPARPIREL